MRRRGREECATNVRRKTYAHALPSMQQDAADRSPASGPICSNRVKSTAPPLGRTCGYQGRCGASGVKSSLASPPPPETCMRAQPATLTAKTIWSSGPQLAPRIAAGRVVSVCAGPPDKATFRNSPSATKPTHWPSDEKNGTNTPTVSGITVASNWSMGRRKRWSPSSPRALYTRVSPSGDRASGLDPISRTLSERRRGDSGSRWDEPAMEDWPYKAQADPRGRPGSPYTPSRTNKPAGEPESPAAECTVRRTRRFGRSMPTRLRPRALRVRGRLETEPGGDERPLHRGRHWRPRPARAYIPPRQLRREADPDGSDWDLR